jgi:hypothetical protein
MARCYATGRLMASSKAVAPERYRLLGGAIRVVVMELCQKPLVLCIHVRRFETPVS